MEQELVGGTSTPTLVQIQIEMVRVARDEGSTIVVRDDADHYGWASADGAHRWSIRKDKLDEELDRIKDSPSAYGYFSHTLDRAQGREGFAQMATSRGHQLRQDPEMWPGWTFLGPLPTTSHH